MTDNDDGSNDARMEDMDDAAANHGNDDDDDVVVVLDDDDDDDDEEDTPVVAQVVSGSDTAAAAAPTAAAASASAPTATPAPAVAAAAKPPAAVAAAAAPSITEALNTLAAAAAVSSPSQSVSLAGFADAATPSITTTTTNLAATAKTTTSAATATTSTAPTTPAATTTSTKSTLFNWMTSTPLFGSRPSPPTATTTDASDAAQAEGAKEGEIELPDNDDEDNNEEGGDDEGDEDDEIEVINDTDEEGGGSLTVTPAAEAILNAIPIDTSNTATTAITLMDEQDEEKEEEEIEEIMREMRHQNDHEEEQQVEDNDNELMAVEGGAGEEEANINAEEAAARNTSDILNRDALYSTYESNYASLQSERDALRRRLAAAQADADKRSAEKEALQLEYDDMKLKFRQGEEKILHIQSQLSSEQAQRMELQRTLEHTNDKIDRASKEADTLRSEIARLSQSNQEMNTHLSSMSIQHSVSASEAIPLRLQVKRLEQELHAITVHSNYLEGELSNKNEVLALSERNHSKEVREVRGELDRVRASLERRDGELSSMRASNERLSKEMDRLRKQFHEKELEYASQYEMLEQDLNKERELVLLKDQRASLAEDRYGALQREVASMTEMARKASDEASAREEEIRRQYTEMMEEALHRVREEEGRKVQESEERARLAEEAKLTMEEEILGRGGMPRRRSISSRRMIEGGTGVGGGAAAGEDDSSNLLLLDDGGGPLGLTDLYTRLAETEDDLRAERHENQKLKIIIDRIHRDVAAKTPIFHQRQLELEGALEELEVTRERLEYARREYVDIRADNQDLELRYGQLERECAEWKKENVDLATQVQSLLQRRAAQAGDFVSFDGITTLQKQNQKLLRDHHVLTTKIAELEDKIKNDPDVIELNSLRSEVSALREERETQAKLVAGIVHQRDLYRALVAKNDAPLLLAQEGTTTDQLALIDARAEQLPLIEARNRDLAEEVAKWKVEASSSKHEREALEVRLARVNAHAEELTTSNERLRGDLTTAKATAARLEIDVSHYQGQVERLEMSLAMAKSENESESRRRTELEELVGKTESHLEAVRSELAKKEQQYQQATSKMRLLKVQLETSTSNEKRIESEASALRSEIARQETLLSSVQRIEASLTAKSEAALENLQEELLRLKELKSDDDTKYSAANQKLEGKIADLELVVKDLTAQKEAATVEATKAKLEGSKLKVKIQELTLNLKTAEKELTAAKVKLGDVTIDTSAEEAAEAKIVSLSSELESAKSELELAQKRIADYQAIAKSSEAQLAELTAASTKYKEETTSTLEKLRKSEQSQRETVIELTNDLMSHRGEKEKAINELNAKVDSLTAQLVGSKEDAVKAIARTDSLTAEAKRYQLDAKSAKVNYERELALHAEARTELRDAWSALESEQRLRESAESQLASSLAEFEVEKVTWELTKTKLEESLQEAKSRLEVMRSQNNLLHDQMASLSVTVKKFQSDKASRIIGDESSSVEAAVDATGSAVSDGEKQLSDLRELLKFKQSECTMLEADLASVKRSSERERAAAELAKRSLEEARSELKVLREGTIIEGAGGASVSEIDNLRSKLKSAEDQLVLIRESNTMLREESQKVAKKLSDVTTEFNLFKSSTCSQIEQVKNMEIMRSSLEAEKESLSQEVEAWKKRVHSLISKFNQIDPEEHAQALASVEQLKSEVASLKSQAEASASKADALISSLNKEVVSQKASIGAFKAALEKTKKEKEELTKSAKSNIIALKKAADAQAAAKQTETDLTAAKSEVNALNARVTSLKKIMGTMQTNLQATKASEIKAKASEESLQKEIASLKEQLVVASNTCVPASAPAIEAAHPSSSATSEKSQAGTGTGGTEMASPPAEAIDADEVQLVESTKAQDMSLSESQPASTAETVEIALDTAADQNVAATDLEKKKGRKRKANSPKKNVVPVPGSAVEISDAPPLKKAATEAVAANVVNPPVIETMPVNAAVPTQKKIVLKKLGAEKVVPSTTSTAGVSEKPSATAAGSTKLPMSKKFTKKPIVATTTPSADSAAGSTMALAAENQATTAESKKEEEMKMKLELMKRKKAAAMARKLEAEKQLSAKKLKTESTQAKEGSGEAAAGNVIDNKPSEPAIEKSTADQKSPLSPVLENAEAANTTKMAPSASDDTTSKPIVFGSSATVTTLPIPKATPTPSEPYCPKPSFFGTPAPTFGSPALPLGGAAPTTAAFGSGTTTPFSFGELAKKSPEGSDEKEDPKPGGSEAFLNLTPPGKSGGVQGKFVFGKSANITLAVPSGTSLTAAQTLASLGKGLASPFGGGFGGTQPTFGASPFGGEITTLPLSTASAEEKEQPTHSESQKEEGEVPDGEVVENSEMSPDAAGNEA